MGRLRIELSKLLQGVVLLFFTLILMEFLHSGSIYDLVSPVIADVEKLTIVVLSIVTLLTLLSSVSLNKQDACTCHREHDCEENDGHHLHSHLSLNSTWGRITMCLLAATIGLMLTWHPQAIGSDLLGSAGSNASGSYTNNYSSISNRFASEGIAIQTSNEVSEASISQEYGTNPSAFYGKPVTLIGFVDKPHGLGQNYLILTRYFIFCCIADAQPDGIIVESPMSKYLKENEWVKVTGVIRTKDIPFVVNYFPTSWASESGSAPYIEATNVTPIPVPKLPYMVPNI